MPAGAVNRFRETTGFVNQVINPMDMSGGVDRENVETAIRKRIEDGVGNLYVLVNYTALFSTHNILKKMEGEKE